MKIIKINKLDTVWYIFFICSFLLPPILGIAHYILTAFILLMTITRTHLRVIKEYSDCLVWFILFTVYISTSKIWAISSTNSQGVIIIALFETAIVFYCILDYVKNEKKLIQFAEIFANSMVVLAVSYYITSPINTWGTEAMGNWLYIWRNAAGYYFGFAAIMIVYIFFNKKREKQLMIKALFLVLAAIGTGSRKIFLLAAVAILVYILIQPGFQKRLKYIICATFLVGLTSVVLFKIPAIRDMYAERLILLLQGVDSSDSSTVVRTMLRGQAFELFLKNPIIGNGLEGFVIWLEGQTSFLNRWAMSATYSHCNYTELLANFGIVGFLLYYFFPFIQVLKGIKHRSNLITQLGIIIIVDCVILDIGTVSYYFKYCLYILLIGIVCIRFGIKSERSLNGR